MALEIINPKYVNTNEALDIITKIGNTSASLPTLINWIRKYNIGKKIGGRWWINKQQLISMLKQGNPHETT